MSWIDGLTRDGETLEEIDPQHVIIRRFIDGELYGVNEFHPDPQMPSEPCGGWVPVNRNGDDRHWTLVSEHPLTLSPSLRCGRCPSHGYIRDGRWIEA
jgi:hypothetical protein